MPAARRKFDIRSGKAMCAPVDKDLAVYDLRVEGEDLLVKLPG